MPFTVEDFHDLVRILEEKPEWRAALRRQVLTDELLALPEQVASLRAETERRFQDLAARVSELTEAVRTLTDGVGDLKGEVLENRYRTKGPAYFGRIIRRAHVLSSDELIAMVEDAVDSGVLSDAQAQEIYEADVVVRGKRREDGAEVYLVVEVSWGVGTDDVTRATRRSALLAHTGVTVIPVVAGKWVTPDATQLARAEKVWQLTDGRAVPPEPPQAN